MLVPLLAVACATSRDAPGESQPRLQLVVDFDAPLPDSALPPGWVLAETNGRGSPASWGPCPGRDQSGGFGVLASENFGDTCNLALLEGAEFVQLTASVFLRAVEGERARGGGLCFRLRDAANYWLAAWDARAGRVELAIVRDGARRTLATAAVGAPAGTFHRLGVRVRGMRKEVSFDEVVVIEHDDSEDQLAQPGTIGLWTAADALTWFDELRVR